MIKDSIISKAREGATTQSGNGFDVDVFVHLVIELTVKECIELLPEDSHNKDMIHTSWVLKEHFGII